MKTSLKTIIAVMSLTATLGLAEAADYHSSDFKQAWDSFMKVSDHGEGSAKKLVESWQSILAEDTADPFALVMVGSSQTLRGRDAWMPWSKMSHTETGLDNMARAVRMLKPEHAEQTFQGMSVTHHVKTMAAITFTQVPEFFGRHEDGFYLLQDVLSDPAFLALPAPAQTFAFYYGINAANQIGQLEQSEDWKAQLTALSVDDGFTQAALELEVTE